MKKVLFVLVGIILMGACSKQEDVTPDCSMDSDEFFVDDLFEQVKLMTKDTIGLSIMSYAQNICGDIYKDKLIFTGLKHNKFWFGVYSHPDTTLEKVRVGKEILTYTSEIDYTLHREINLGYGEKDSLHIDKIFLSIWGDVESKNFEVSIIGRSDAKPFDEKFVAFDFLLVRNGVEKCFPDTYYDTRIAWYDNSVILNNFREIEFGVNMAPDMKLYSKEGKILYSWPEGAWDWNLRENVVVPVSFEEGIFHTGTGFKRVDIFEDKVKWSFVVSGFQEDARLSFLKYDEIGQFWYYQVNATNYDGTKESKILKIDIESGEYWLWMDAPVEDVFIEELEEDKDFALGVEQQLHYKVSPENVYDEGIKVSSSDESIVSIDENMVLRTHSKGKAIITISSGDGSITKKYEIEVKNMLSEVSLIELEECRNLVLGSKLQTHCKLFPEDADNLNVNIHSSDESVVSIEGGTILCAKSKGKAIVTISSEDGNATKSYEVEVDDIEAWIKLSVSSAGMSIGGIYTGSLSCSLVNASHATIHVSSVKIVDGNGTTLNEGGEDLLQDILPNSTSREFSVQINKAYKPKVIWIYEYEGVEYEVVHEI